MCCNFLVFKINIALSIGSDCINDINTKKTKSEHDYMMPLVSIGIASRMEGTILPDLMNISFIAVEILN